MRACSVVGQWRKHAVVVGSEWVEEEFVLAGAGGGGERGRACAGRTLRYRQVSGQFSNPNPAVAKASLEWLWETCRTVLCNDDADAGEEGAKGAARHARPSRASGRPSAAGTHTAQLHHRHTASNSRGVIPAASTHSRLG